MGSYFTLMRSNTTDYNIDSYGLQLESQQKITLHELDKID